MDELYSVLQEKTEEINNLGGRTTGALHIIGILQKRKEKQEKKKQKQQMEEGLSEKKEGN